jgi:hypothetical protein
MPAQVYQVIYACTPAQFATVIAAMKAAAGATVIQAPIQFQGILKLSTNEQIDFSYDGQYYLRFFGANNVPVSAQTQTGIPATEVSPTMLTFLNANVVPTTGAAVPSNAANVPGPAGSATGPI